MRKAFLNGLFVHNLCSVTVNLNLNLRRNFRIIFKMFYSNFASFMSFKIEYFKWRVINHKISKNNSLRLTFIICSILHIEVLCIWGTKIPFHYFCDSTNIIEISRCLLFFSKILRMILKNSDILFGSDYKREN